MFWSYANGWLRVFYGVSTGSLRCFGEGVARTRTVTVRLSYGGLYRLTNKQYTSVWARADPYGMPYDHPRVTGILALTVPVNYPGAPCDLGIMPYEHSRLSQGRARATYDNRSILRVFSSMYVPVRCSHMHRTNPYMHRTITVR